MRNSSSFPSATIGLLRHRFAMVAVLLAACLPFDCASAQPASTPLWELAISAVDADISPDDQLLAITTRSPDFPKHGQPVNESVAIWDYKQHKEIAKAAIGSSLIGLWSQSSPVRFTYDGALLVAADRQSIHVSDAATLKPLRRIEPPFSGGLRIQKIETSPVSRVALVTADNNGVHGELLAYNLDDGRELLRRTDMPRATSIARKPDGTQFAVAMPLPCSSSGDVEVFSFPSSAQVMTLHGRDLESVAFGTDRLYAVQTSFCKGSVFNRHLGMKVFDTHWKHKKRIVLAHEDIHDSVSYANGEVLADTGTVRTQFDAMDMTAFSGAVAAQVSVWNSDASSIIYTSDPVYAQQRWRRSTTCAV